MNRLQEWKRAFAVKSFRVESAATFAVFTSVIYPYTRYMDWNEQRVGVRLDDPILPYLPTWDLTWVIFVVLYASAILASWETLQFPKRWLRGMRMYTLIVIFRWIALYLVPLEPPEGLIMLHDPFVMLFIQSGSILNKDLFFSGHTATMLMFVLMVNRPWMRGLLSAGTVFVASAVLIQRVHYSVDVFVALIVAYAAYRLTFRDRI